MAYDFSDVSVLIVEDNQPMVDLLKSLLEAYGITDVHSAKDGDAGFELFKKELPDLILSTVFPLRGACATMFPARTNSCLSF